MLGFSVFTCSGATIPRPSPRLRHPARLTYSDLGADGNSEMADRLSGGAFGMNGRNAGY
jgi:hypothetical protein